MITLDAVCGFTFALIDLCILTGYCSKKTQGVIVLATEKTVLTRLLSILPTDDISSRPMMGEYPLYYRGRMFGMVCDNRLLIKPVAAAVERMPNAPLVRPYEGAKDMLLVDETQPPTLLLALLESMYDQLPEKTPSKKKTTNRY